MAANSLDFSFSSEAVDDGTLLVSKITGVEQISELFRFEVELLSQDPNLDLEAILYAPAKLGFRHQIELAGQRVYMTRWTHGVLSGFSVVGEEESWIRYRAILVPQMWLLTQSWRSRVFLESTTSKNVKTVLMEYGLADKIDFEFTMEDELNREYVVQYDESDYDFVARWLEDEGIHYYFTNDGTAEKVTFANATAHPPIEGNAFLPYLHFGGGSKGVGAAAPDGDEAVRGLSCEQVRLPKDVALNDYNWRDPSQVLDCDAEVQPRGVGVHYEYNNHYKTVAEGKVLAGIRSDELKTHELVYSGESNCPSFRPGYTFTLNGHFRDDFNREYVLTTVRHEIEQGIALSRGGTVTGAKYTNSFEAIASERVFRPERKTPWPSIKGVMHGSIDTSAIGEYAELDDYGRYKVRIPFDHKKAGEKDAGAASRYLRMAQPYAGQDAGMHFPLLKGTEVLLSHIDGDPDRPIIASAVPNPETMSPVTSNDFKRNRIHTKAGNRFQMDDDQKRGGLRIEDSSGSRVFASTGPMRPREASDVEGGDAGLWGDVGDFLKDAFKKMRPKPHVYTTPWKAVMANTKVVVPGYDLNPKLQQVFNLTKPSQLPDSIFPTIAPKKSDWDDIIAEDGTSAVLDCITATHITEVRVGNKYNIEHGAFKLTYGDIGADITVSTSGGYAFIINEAGGAATSEALNMGGTVDRSYTECGTVGWAKVIGGTDDYSEVEGGVVSKSKVTGETKEEADFHGKVTSDTHVHSGGTKTTEEVHGGTNNMSKVYGGEHTEEYRFGTKFQFSFTLAAFNEEVVNLGVFNTNTFNGGLFVETSLTLGRVDAADICIGARVGFELTIIEKLDMEIVLGLKQGIVLVLGHELDVTLTPEKVTTTIPEDDKITINEVNAAIKTSEAKISDTTATLASEAVALKAETAALKADAVALKESNTALKADTVALSEANTALKAETTTLKADVTSLKESNTALSAETTSLKADVTALSANTTAAVVKVGV